MNCIIEQGLLLNATKANKTGIGSSLLMAYGNKSNWDKSLLLTNTFTGWESESNPDPDPLILEPVEVRNGFLYNRLNLTIYYVNY